jgi:SAM-dependent methyltransferase
MEHDRVLADSFDAQAERFAKAPIQNDPVHLSRLVAFASIKPGGTVLDAGCGPGLVAEAFLNEGYRVRGVDLSGEMVRLARLRCARFGDRASLVQGSIFDVSGQEPFDGSVSRFVLHHATDPVAFVAAQAARVRPGGVVVSVDHTTDAVPDRAHWHQAIEKGRDRSHARNLTPGQVIDVFARAGLCDLRLLENSFELDFDEWFDRGVPSMPKPEVRARILEGSARGFAPELGPDGGITLRCVFSLVRGVRPGGD